MLFWTSLFDAQAGPLLQCSAAELHQSLPDSTAQARLLRTVFMDMGELAMLMLFSISGQRAPTVLKVRRVQESPSVTLNTYLHAPRVHTTLPIHHTNTPSVTSSDVCDIVHELENMDLGERRELFASPVLNPKSHTATPLGRRLYSTPTPLRTLLPRDFELNTTTTASQEALLQRFQSLCPDNN